MIQNEKGCIRQFDLVIYPTPIVIVIGDMEKDVNNIYKPYDAAYNYLGKPLEDFSAVTYEVKDKESNDSCVLIWFSTLDACRGSYMCHEVTHASLVIFKYTGAKVDFNNQEPFAYLTGAIMRLANQTVYEYKEFLEKKKSKSKKK